MVGVVENEAVDHGIDSPLAGLGYGLPISRSYCRYFGGDLSIMSMEGYGTDAFVYLARIGNTKEPVPIWLNKIWPNCRIKIQQNTKRIGHDKTSIAVLNFIVSIIQSFRGSCMSSALTGTIGPSSYRKTKAQGKVLSKDCVIFLCGRRCQKLIFKCPVKTISLNSVQ